MRIAIVVSALWLIVSFLVVREGVSSDDFLTLFVSWGFIPLVVVWGIAWIIQGFRGVKRPIEYKSDNEEGAKRDN